MTPKTRTITFRPDDELFDAMDRIRERHGTPYSVQLRRALRVWLEEQGEVEKADRKRAATRKRS